MLDNSISQKDTSDEELVSLALKKQDDFVYIVEKYQAPLLRYIRRLSNVSLEEAEDILQAIFIKTYVNLNGFDKRLKFSSWIYRIAHNEVISFYRKKQTRPEASSLQLEDVQIKKLSSYIDIHSDVIAKERAEEIRTAIASLDIKYQEVIILKFIEDKDYKEIADIIKKPIGTVASRINKGKKELRKILNK
jgi:RNA polymerase sigma-70 factor (ECF subfamily)